MTHKLRFSVSNETIDNGEKNGNFFFLPFQIIIADVFWQWYIRMKFDKGSMGGEAFV